MGPAWGRETPVPDSASRKMDDRARWQCIREARLPDYYTGAPDAGHLDGRFKVRACVVKSVLMELGRFAPEKTIYEGVDHIAFATQIPARTVKQALRVLVQHGLLSRETQKRKGLTKVTVIHWDRIEALRETFRSSESAPEDAEGLDNPDDDPPAKYMDKDSDAGRVAAKLLELKHVGPRLSEREVGPLASGLVRRYGAKWVQRAVESLPEKTLAIASNPDTRSPAAYLRTCIDRAITENAQQQ
jgi:hypothetical protein